MPRDVASRAAKLECDQGKGAGTTGLAVYLDFADSIQRLGEEVIRDRYGNLFDMYNRITDEDPYRVPMRIFPAVHYTMGGLWVDYNLMSTIPGLHVLGEANFSDHGANRLGASALMQGLADGYFVIPYTLGDYLAGTELAEVTTDHQAFDDSVHEASEHLQRLLSIQGSRTPRELHRDLGRILWDDVGMSRSAEGLEHALQEIPKLREAFWNDLTVPGDRNMLNKSLELANRIGDYMELAELMARDALDRDESCGGHFREEHQTGEGEAERNDEKFCHVSAWEYAGENKPPVMHREPLTFKYAEIKQRSYK